jgi:acetyl esterase/lipase
MSQPSVADKATGWGITADEIAWGAGLWVPDAALRADPRVSPLHATNLAGLPPAVIVTAEHDPLRNEGEAQVAKDLKPVYTAASEAEALDRFAEFSGKWERRYPAIIRLWENAWPEFVPFLAFDREIRTVICTTNAIESINARLRRAVNARGHFPTFDGRLSAGRK